MLFFSSKRLHKFKKFEKLGVKAGCTIKFIVSISGGGKRARVSVADLRPMENDPPIIRAIFAETSFNFGAFIDTIDRTTIISFISTIEKTRTISQQIQSTVDHIPAFKSVKVKTT